MLKTFFESPEISAIFTPNIADRGTENKFECSGCSKLRVSKHAKKRDHTLKKTAKISRGEKQRKTLNFSDRNTEMADAKKVENTDELQADNIYYDYDDKTGAIIQKKHSTFLGIKQPDIQRDPRGNFNVDLNGDGSIEKFIKDLHYEKATDGSCLSDSAYDTTPDDLTDSLERFTFPHEILVEENFDFKWNENENVAKTKNESPYTRCRSSAVCGRNCELCRGTNHNVVSSRKQVKELVSETLYSKSKQQQNGYDIGRNDVLSYAENHTMKRNSERKSVHGLENNGRQELTTEENFGSIGNERKVIFRKHHENLLPLEHKPRSEFQNMMRQRYKNMEIQLCEQKLSPGSLYNLTSNPNNMSQKDFENQQLTKHYIDDNEDGETITTTPFLDRDVSYEYFEFDEHEAMYPYSQASMFAMSPQLLLLLYDFKGEQDEDLSLRKGDVVTLLDDSNKDWVWVMTIDNEEGYVPKSLTMPYSDCVDCEECRQEELHKRQNSSKSRERSLSGSQRSNASSTRSSLTSPVVEQRNIISDSIYQTEKQGSPRSLSGSQRSNASSTRSRLTSQVVQQRNLISDHIYQSEKQVSPQNNRTLSNLSQISPRKNNSLIDLYETNYANNSSKARQISEFEENRIKAKSIRLIALSSFQGKEEEMLSVNAGDDIYVNLKDQLIPEWLWAYSTKQKRYGFIPESIIDQLKSSSV